MEYSKHGLSTTSSYTKHIPLSNLVPLGSE